jgi:F-type H+-transporting ATPase subunit c
MVKKTVLIVMVGLVFLALPALAQEPAAAAGGSGVKWGVLGAAFLLGLAAAAGAAAQGRATAAACDGMSRNPGAVAPIRLMAIIGLALIESLVLYALLIAFLIYGK